MVATKKQKYKKSLELEAHHIKHQYQNPTNMNINELGPKILEKTAKKAY